MEIVYFIFYLDLVGTKQTWDRNFQLSLHNSIAFRLNVSIYKCNTHVFTVLYYCKRWVNTHHTVKQS